MTDSENDTSDRPAEEETEKETTSDGTPVDPGSADGEKSRRWLIRLLVGLGIGIPVLVEGATFLKLFSAKLFGGEDESAGETPTPAGPARIGVGDELLPATAPAETIRKARIRVQQSSWRFVMTVEVVNTTEAPYVLQFGSLTTTTGRTIEDGTTTGRIPPGESRRVTATWSLQENERPETLSVTGLSYAGDGVQATEREVHLDRVPVLG